MQRKLKHRCDTEITATSTHSPVEIRVLLRASVAQLPIGGDQVHGEDVVRCQPKPARDAPKPAAQG